MAINSIPAADFPAAYPQVERFFASFTERARGRFPRGFLEREVLDSERQCYVATRDDGVVACALTVTAPNGAVTLDYCSGDDMKDWPEELLEFFENGCRERGVDLIVIPRKGWVRRLNMKQRGYQNSHMVMEFRNGREKPKDQD